MLFSSKVYSPSLSLALEETREEVFTSSNFLCAFIVFIKDPRGPTEALPETETATHEHARIGADGRAAIGCSLANRGLQ